MKESRYRESRLCRVLGNPVVYAMVAVLDEHGPLSPSAVATRAGRRLQTVSGHLATLRAVDLVRYDRQGGRTRPHPAPGRSAIVPGGPRGIAGGSPLLRRPQPRGGPSALAAFVKEAGPPPD
jgi:hypothetical protein